MCIFLSSQKYLPVLILLVIKILEEIKLKGLAKQQNFFFFVVFKSYVWRSSRSKMAGVCMLQMRRVLQCYVGRQNDITEEIQYFSAKFSSFHCNSLKYA